MEHSDTLDILKKLETGEISADEARARLETPPVVERVETPPFDPAQIPNWVRRIWLVPLTLGVLIVVLGTWVITASRTNILWFLLGLPLVLLGSLVIAIGAGGFSGHWLYVNVEPLRKHHHAIRFALPFPMGLLRFGLWIVRFVQPYPCARVRVSTARSKFDAFWDDPDELIDALERELREGRGITVDVDDQDARVQVYIV